MSDPPKRTWSVQQSAELYQVDRWGRNFYSIGSTGNLLVHPFSDRSQNLPLVEIVQHCARQGFSPPLLVRFPDIIVKRVDHLTDAFQSAIREFKYGGEYRLVYPIKVNQFPEVLDAVMRCNKTNAVGLEAGSKAELIAVLAAADLETIILCNGFKDADYIEMAMRAAHSGFNITIVIEKPSEIPLIAACSERIGARPRLGIRIKLASRNSGHWNSSAGSRSKFGLTIPELLAAIDHLQRLDQLDCLKLLHFHPGSQINNVREIKSALIEVTRVYVDLVHRGVPIETIDVGGGLAVDYTGNQDNHPSSMNYTLQEYANDVIYYVQMICDGANVPHPDIVSESGRAVMAHHCVLIVPLLGSSQLSSVDNGSIKLEPEDFEIQPLIELRETYGEIDSRNLLECYHDAQHALEMTKQLFANGHMTLRQRSIAEQFFWSICRRIRQFIGDVDFVPRELDELRYQFSDTYFGNFSLFQSIPDYWAIEHLFPIMPIHRLEQRPTAHGVIGDMTCDSDGRIERFIGPDGPRRFLPLHECGEGDTYWVGIFLVGAYQEIMGSLHNLLGSVHTATVENYGDEIQISTRGGCTVRDMLDRIRFAGRENAVSADSAGRREPPPGLGSLLAGKHAEFFQKMLDKYTYFSQSSPSGQEDLQPHLPVGNDKSKKPESRRADLPL